VTAFGWKIETVKYARSHILVFIICLGATLRAQQVDQPYVDWFGWREASTAMMADNFYKGNWNIFLPQVNWGGPAPSYQAREFQTVTYIAAILYKIVGKHDWIGRCISILFGMFGIISLYRLIDLIWDREIAILGSLILAVLPGSIFIDRSFLPDPAMTSLATASLWLFAKYTSERKLSSLVLSITMLTLACLTKPQALTVILPMAYLAILQRHERTFERNHIRLIFVLSSLGFFLFGTYYLWALYLGTHFPPYHIAGAGKFIWENSLSSWLSNWYYLPSNFSIVKNWLWGWVVLGLTCAGLILPMLVNNRIERPWVFHFWGFAFLIDYLLEAQHLSTDEHNMSIASPLAASLAGLGLVLIWRNIKPKFLNEEFKSTIYALVLLAIAIPGQLHLRKWFADIYWPYYELGNELARMSEANDLLVSFGKVPIAIYYSGLHGWQFPPADVWVYMKEHTIDGPQRINLLESLRKRGARWIVITWDHYPTQEPLLNDYLNSRYELVYDSPAGKIYRSQH